jgi:hypothetical protein
VGALLHARSRAVLLHMQLEIADFQPNLVVRRFFDDLDDFENVVLREVHSRFCPCACIDLPPIV